MPVESLRLRIRRNMPYCLFDKGEYINKGEEVRN